MTFHRSLRLAALGALAFPVVAAAQRGGGGPRAEPANPIQEGLPLKPERTIRFIWPCEVECTIALLNGRPEFASRTLATIHLDMIGGDTEKTKSILRVEGSPPSLPSFVDDVAFSIAKWVNG